MPILLSLHLLLSVAKDVDPAKAVEAIKLSPHTEESTYFIARILMNVCEWILNLLGLGSHKNLFITLYVIMVFAFAMVIGILIKWIVVTILHKVRPHITSPLYGHLIEHKFFTKTCRIIPTILFLIFIQFTLYMHNSIAFWLTRLTCMFLVVQISVSVCTLFDVAWETIDERENKRKLPLRGILQVIKLIIWIIATIIIAALLFDKSPGRLLAGLGAFAAVLMLVFKDSILGIVAGVQLSQNNSLHVGDWIILNNGQANGTVSEVSLTDVKIINWDKTVSTVPPYTLISSGFKNMRNMQESKTRRIQRSYMIDADSVVETTPEMLAEFAKIPLIKEWVEKKIEQRNQGKEQDVDNSEGLADGTISTNLGVFRAYMRIYLSKNANISQADTCFVTTLEQTPTGIPLQIYCFTNTSAWLSYESIQAGVFEHLATMLHKFGLYTFENPSGRDTIIDGYMSPGKSPADLFGIPYPFFINSGTPEDPGILPTADSTPKQANSTDAAKHNK